MVSLNERLPEPEQQVDEVVEEPKCFCGRLLRSSSGDATKYAAWLEDVRAGRLFVVPPHESTEPRRIDESVFQRRQGGDWRNDPEMEIFRGDDGVGVDANALADLAVVKPLV